jgi:uncharacterized membrane protein
MTDNNSGRCWNDAANWNQDIIYFSKEDSRLFVPKKPTWMGWTINFGHPYAPWILMATLVALPIGAVYAERAKK